MNLLQRPTLRDEPSSPTPSLRLATPMIAVWLAALVVLTVLPHATTRLMTWPFAAIAWIWWLFPIILALALLLRPARLDPLLAATGLLLLLAGFASATWSPLRQLSTPHLWPVVGLGAMFLVAARHAVPRSSTQIALPVMAGGFSLLSFIGWVAAHQGQGPLWQTRNDYPFGHSITTAGALLLGLPWLILALLGSKRLLARLAWSIPLLAALGAIAATSSRAAIGTLGLGVTVATILTLCAAPWSRRRKTVIVVLAFITITAGVMSNERLRDLVLHQQWSGIAAASNDQRGAMIEAGWRLWERHPWFGYGPGSIPFVYPLVRPQLGSAVDSVLQLHSTPVHIAATLGLAGVSAILLGIAWWLTATHRLIRAVNAHPIDCFPSLAAWFSLSFYALFALTDYQLDQPWIATLLVLNASILAQPGPPGGRTRPILRSAIAILGLAAVILAAPRTLRDLRARRAYDQALASTSEAAALDGFAAAAAINPLDPYYRHQEASLAFQLSLNAPDAATRVAFRHRARQALESTLQAGPPPEYAALNLAWLDLEDNHPAEALQMFAAARLFAPTRQDLLVGTALAQYSLGQEIGAAHTLAIAFLHDPTDLANPLWSNPAVQRLPSLARAWLTARVRGLVALYPDIHDRLAQIETLTIKIETVPTRLPLPPPYLRRRDGYPVLAYHPDGPAPVDFQIVTPPSAELVPPREVQPGIYLGLPAPVLLTLLDNPPPPDVTP